MSTNRKPESDFLEFFLSDKNRKTCAFLGLNTFKKIKKYQKINREQEELRNEINYEMNKVKVTLSRTFVPAQKQAVQDVEIEVIPEKKEVKETPGSYFTKKLDAKVEILKIKIYEKFVKCEWWNKFYHRFLEEIIFKNEIHRITNVGLNDQPEKKLFNKTIENLDKSVFPNIIYHLTNPTEYSYAEIYKLIHLSSSSRDNSNADTLIEFLQYKEFRDLLLSMKFYERDDRKTEESSLSFLRDQLQKTDSYNLLVSFDSLLSELIGKYKPYNFSKKKNVVFEGELLLNEPDPADLEGEELVTEILGSDENLPQLSNQIADLEGEKTITKVPDSYKKDWLQFAAQIADVETDLFGVGHTDRKVLAPEPETSQSESDVGISKEHLNMYMNLLNGDKTILDKIIQFKGNDKSLFFKINKIDSNLMNTVEVFDHFKKHYSTLEKEKKTPVTKLEKPTVEKDLVRYLSALNDNKDLLETILRSVKSGNKETFFKENKIEKNMTDIIDIWDDIRLKDHGYINKLLDLLGKKAIDIIPDVPTLTDFTSLSVADKEKTAKILWETVVAKAEKTPEFLKLVTQEEQDKYLMEKMKESFESYFPVKKPEAPKETE